jgi:hypothetical protein
MPTDTDWFPADHPDGLDTDPLWPSADPPSAGRGPLQDLRWQRQTRPRWQRIAFVSVLAVLFALLFDPSRVLFAGLALAIAAILWPVLGWPGRIVSWTLAVAWTMGLVSWQYTIPRSRVGRIRPMVLRRQPTSPDRVSRSGATGGGSGRAGWHHPQPPHHQPVRLDRQAAAAPWADHRRRYPPM